MTDVPEANADDVPPPVTPVVGRGSEIPGRIWFRWIVAIAGFVALMAILANTYGAGQEETDRLEPSAVRLAAIYAEGAFYGVIGVGAILCGYILSRVERTSRDE